jgi:hypothetical protein
MFDLEQSIADWRQGMVAKGIGSPVPLEELESHLREDVERQIEAGADEQEAFERAVARFGLGEQLKMEFARAGGWRSWLGNNGATRVDHGLGGAWLILSLSGLSTSIWSFGQSMFSQPHGLNLVLLCFIFLEICFVRISLQLYQGSVMGRAIIGLLAVLGGISFLIHVIYAHPISAQDLFFFAFDIVTLCLLWWRSRQNPETAAK